MAINHKYYNSWSPLVITDLAGGSLFSSQLAWGMVVDRYETYVKPGAIRGTAVFYPNAEGAELLRSNGGFSAPLTVVKMLEMIAANPFTFMKIYARHIASGLDARDGEVYAQEPSSDKTWQSLLFLVIVLSGLAQLIATVLAKDANRSRQKKIIYSTILLLPCLAIIPGAIETRFFFPVFCLAYCALSMEKIRKSAIVGQVTGTAILLAAIFTFTQQSIQNPIYGRPEAYLTAQDAPDRP